MKISLKYLAVSMAVQLISCASLWLASVLLSSDSLFNIIVYFYWPCMILVGASLGSSGESAMIAVPILGMLLGMVFYSIIFTVIVGFLKRKRG